MLFEHAAKQICKHQLIKIKCWSYPCKTCYEQVSSFKNTVTPRPQGPQAPRLRNSIFQVMVPNPAIFQHLQPWCHQISGRCWEFAWSSSLATSPTFAYLVPVLPCLAISCHVLPCLAMSCLTDPSARHVARNTDYNINKWKKNPLQTEGTYSSIQPEREWERHRFVLGILVGGFNNLEK